MNVLFVHTGKAFLPELEAYRAAIQAEGYAADVVHEEPDGHVTKDYDLVFRFGGLLGRLPGSATPEIHEYHSASTTKLPRLKNIVKSLASPRPAGRIFLNAFVRRQFNFPDRVPYLLRDMGASPDLLACRTAGDKAFDIVYAGSISGRSGLVEVLLTLARKGLTLGIAGAATGAEADVLRQQKGIEFVGRLPGDEVPGFLSRGRMGLNYCPDVYPLKYQTSTKVIEYLVAGLPIVSNEYEWINDHAKRHGYRYVALNSLGCTVDLRAGKGTVLGVEQAKAFTWPEMLTEVGFVDFLRDTIRGG